MLSGNPTLPRGTYNAVLSVATRPITLFAFVEFVVTNTSDLAALGEREPHRHVPRNGKTRLFAGTLNVSAGRNMPQTKTVHTSTHSIRFTRDSCVILSNHSQSLEELGLDKQMISRKQWLQPPQHPAFTHAVLTSICSSHDVSNLSLWRCCDSGLPFSVCVGIARR